MIQKSLLGLFAYVSNRVPEIADDIFSIDNAIKAGFAWEAGPFQFWDMLGIEKGVQLAEAQGEKIAPWVKEMLAAGHTTFYKSENGKPQYYDVASKSYNAMPGGADFIVLDNIRSKTAIYSNSETTLILKKYSKILKNFFINYYYLVFTTHFIFRSIIK